METLYSARGIPGPGRSMSCKGRGVCCVSPDPCYPPTGRGTEALAEKPPQKDGKGRQLWKAMLKKAISKKIRYDYCCLGLEVTGDLQSPCLWFSE